MPACHAGDRRFESGRVRHQSVSPYAPSARPDGAFPCPGHTIPPRERPRARLRPAQDPPAERGARRRDASGPRRRARSPGFRGHGLGSGAAVARTRSPAVAGAIAVIAIVLLIGLGFGSGVLGGLGSSGTGVIAPAPSGAPSATASGVPASPGASAAGLGESPSADPATSAASPSAVLVETDVAIVPVTSFRSASTAARPADIQAIAAGTSAYKRLVLVEADADAILASLGLTRRDLAGRLVTVASADALARNLASKRNRLAFLRADEVGPSVRALAWGGKQLFGVDRVKSLASWPLTARLLGPATPAYDPSGCVDPGRGRRHPPRPRRQAGDRRERRRLSLRRWHGRDHRVLPGLLADGLGPAVHEEDGQRGHRPRAVLGRGSLDRQLREPRPECPALARQRHGVQRRS